jgi:predicted transcriptional regulator
MTDTFGKRKGVKMLTSLLGSKGSEKVLIFLVARGEGYASEIAKFFDLDISTIQNQLDKFDLGGILSSATQGRTRLYVFNPRYPFTKELKQLLEKALSFYPQDEREKLVMERRRPRRRGKPV